MTTASAMASVIIPNWNGAKLLHICLDSLRRQTYRPLEVIVVDGGSTDGSQPLMADSYPEVRLIALETNRGFAGNVNVGLRAAKGHWLIVYNNDAEAEPALVSELVGALLRHPLAGSAAAKILELDRRQYIASAGDLLGRDGIARQRGNGMLDADAYGEPALIFGASGCAAAYRRDMLDDVGLFDEGFVSYLEDVDLALRAQWRGWQCCYVPTARAYHKVSATGGGRIASYYVARNTLRLVGKAFPGTLLRRVWPKIVAAQMERARLAARAWRGEAARATLRGLLVGSLTLPAVVPARSRIMARRRVPDEAIIRLLVE